MLYNKDIKKERTTTMARHYRFLVKFSFDHTPVLAALMVTTSTKKSSQARMAFFVHKSAERCGRYVAYTLMPKHQNQFARECQLAQQHHTCYHHKDDTRYKCAYCFSQCLITGASLFREHFYRTLDNIAMLSRSLR